MKDFYKNEKKYLSQIKTQTYGLLSLKTIYCFIEYDMIGVASALMEDENHNPYFLYSHYGTKTLENRKENENSEDFVEMELKRNYVVLKMTPSEVKDYENGDLSLKNIFNNSFNKNKIIF